MPLAVYTMEAVLFKGAMVKRWLMGSWIAPELLESRRYFSALTAKPDLLPVVQLPASQNWLQGQRHHVPVDIVNIGAGRAKGTTKLSLYLSTDGAVSDDDTLLGQTNLSLNLSTAASKRFTFSFITPGSAATGIYDVIGVISPTRLAEQSIANDTAVAFNPVSVTGANVILTSRILSTPPAVLEGHAAQIRLSITNSGLDTARGDATAKVFASSDQVLSGDDALLGTQAVQINLKPGHSMELTIRFTTSPGEIPNGSEFFIGTAGFGNAPAGTFTADRSLDPKSAPWDFNDHLNSSLTFTNESAIEPLTIGRSDGLALSSGQQVTVSVLSGMVRAGEDRSFVDAGGDHSFSPDFGITPPSAAKYLPASDLPIYYESVIGDFADDNGQVVGQPFALGFGRTVIVPAGATRLQLGVDDTFYGDDSGSLQLRIQAGNYAFSDAPVLFSRVTSVKADLTPVVHVQAGSKWLAQQRQQVPVDIVNLGAGQAKGSVKVSLYLSADSTLSANDTPLGENTLAVNLKSGDSRRTMFSFETPGDVASGAYNVIGVISATKIAQGNTANDTASGYSMPQVTAPDVFLSSEILATPAAVVSGHAEQVQVRITNSGKDTARGNAIIRLFASSNQQMSVGDNVMLTSVKVPVNIRNGKSATVKVNFKTAAGQVPPGNDFITGTIQFGDAPVSSFTIDKTLDAQSAPWVFNDQINAGLQFRDISPGDPLVIGPNDDLHLVAGEQISITVLSGQVQAGSDRPLVDAGGDTTIPTNETDSEIIIPSRYTPLADHPVHFMAILGDFTDSAGRVIGQPFAVGFGRTVIAPAGATQLQLGVNDTVFGDNTGSYMLRIAAASSASSAEPVMFANAE
jgi:hypothetical protein